MRPQKITGLRREVPSLGKSRWVLSTRRWYIWVCLEMWCSPKILVFNDKQWHLVDFWIFWGLPIFRHARTNLGDGVKGGSME